MCGYLYSYDDTLDNILLNFPLSFPDILIGRVGYGVTIMLGLPMVFLPCRGAVQSLPMQWRALTDGSHHDYYQTAARNECFGEETPLVPGNEVDESSYAYFHGNSVAVLKASSSEDDVECTHASSTTASQSDEPDDVLVEDDDNIHFLATLSILIFCYVTSICVPGVAVVWSIAGSSIAIFIGYFIPAACYLKIRSRKGVNPRAVAALGMVALSIATSIICTLRTLSDMYKK